jgi:class 3 adenylate cyclase
MSLISLNSPAPSGRPFWDSFHPVVPEAFRCRIFATTSIFAASRIAEYARESGGLEFRQPGSFLHAVQTDHYPTAMKCCKTLHRLAEALRACYGDDASLVSAEPFIREATALIARYEQEIFNEIEKLTKSEDEGGAKKRIRDLAFVAQDLAKKAQELFEKSVAELESAVTKSALYCGGFQSPWVCVVSLDLAQYGRHSRLINNYSDAEGVFAFNRRIRQELDKALQSVNVEEGRVIVINTGDGALLLFLSGREDRPQSDMASSAYGFSTSFLKAFEEANFNVVPAENQLHFRVGISTGRVALENTCVRASPINQCHVGGLPIGTAVRLQSAAQMGEIVACSRTHSLFPDEVQKKFGEQVKVPGKAHEEEIPAHRCQVVQSG